MKYIHTFWSKPLVEKKFADYNSSLTIILTDYAYSVECVHRLGETIELYADEYGAELLSFISYDKVHIINGLDNENTHFAAQIKFHALKNCELGDVLIDGDLFLRKQEANNIIKLYINKGYDLVYSFFEPPEYTLNAQERVNLHTNGIKKIKENNIVFEEPFYWPCRYEDYAWMNCSLMSFNNQELKDKYIEQYFKHKELLNDVDWENIWPDIIIEQRFLTLLCEKYNIKPILEDFYLSPKAESNALLLGFTHLGGIKYVWNNTLVSIIEKENPSLLNNIMEQINKYKK